MIIYTVGMGPGAEDLIAPRALAAISDSEVVVGYSNYLSLYPAELWAGKELVSTGMTGEIERCKKAIEFALQGKVVSVISSGDSGVYAMAGLIMELVDAQDLNIEVKVIPGITASVAAASVLGAPLMNDFATISLSDLMTSKEVIKNRLSLVAEADMVCVLYNPASKKRRDLIQYAIDTFKKCRGDNGLVAIVNHATRPDEEVIISNLSEFEFEKVGMSSTVIIGASNTIHKNGKFYTLRGYSDKYESAING
jgi:precorrin-3B C17-methyltransferase